MASSNIERIPSLERTIESHVLTPLPLLDAALRNSSSANPPLPNISVSPLHGQFLAIQLQLMNAKSVLEVGTLGGYSSIWFASAGCNVTSIEQNPHHQDVAIENTKALGEGKVDILLGSALDVLPKLVEQGRVFDFVFIDAAWEEQGAYFEWATKLVIPGGGIYVDNVVRALMADEDDGLDLGRKGSLLEMVERMKGNGVKASVVGTASGFKGPMDEWVDGFLMAVVGERKD